MNFARSDSIYGRLNDYYSQSISDTNSPSIHSSEASKLKNDTCLQYSSELPQAEPSTQQNPVSCSENWRFAGWRLGALVGALLAIISLIINLSVIIWLSTHKDSSTGLVEMYRGDCGKVKTMNTWNHLAINVISTLLLGGSNYSMQCLVAPTRDEIDKEHARGKFLDIGVPSIRNLFKISKPKMILWWILGLSSVPLHLFYNSAFYSSIAAVDYDIFVATPDFVSGGTFNLSRVTSYPQNFVSPASVQQELSTYENLTNSECIAAYSQIISTERRTVVIVSSSRNATGNNSLLDARQYVFNESVVPSYGSYKPFEWICSDPDLSQKITLPPPWKDSLPVYWPSCDVYVNLVRQKSDEWAPFGYPADYCLSKRAPQKCSFNANIPIIAAVVVCNALKAIGMLLVAFKLIDRPLITIGDALESFLQSPDPTTKGICWISRQDIQDYATYPLHFPDPCFPSDIRTQPPNGREITVHNRRWVRSASATRWTITISLFVLALATVGGLLGLAIHSISNMGSNAILKLGFGVLQPVAILSGWSIDYITSPSRQILASVIIANLPQVILSFLYLNLNGVITTMWLGAEWNDFATQRKFLRVSNPSGSQRSTHFLQLPYRIAIPLMVMSGLIHYSISQSIFLAVVSEYDNRDHLVNSVEIASCGYSILAIIVTICLTFCLIVTVVVIGFRKFDGRIPLVGSCSAAISAACHRPEWDYDAAMQPVQYGVFDEKDINSDPSVGHCCFTSGEVTFIEDGKRYAGIVKRKGDRKG